jgi:hypothetical protein
MSEFDSRLSLLPDQLVKKNLESWKKVVESYEDWVANPYWKQFIPVYDMVKKLAKSEQAKLFRAGTSMYVLLISTTEQHLLESKDRFVSVNGYDPSGIVIEYKQMGLDAQYTETTFFIDIGVYTIENRICAPDDNLVSAIQPFLDRLWNNTRGTIDAAQSQ